MEDAHSVQLGYADDPHSSYFAVFDGHGGAKFANYCSSQLYLNLQNDPAFSMTQLYIHMHVQKCLGVCLLPLDFLTHTLNMCVCCLYIQYIRLYMNMNINPF